MKMISADQPVREKDKFFSFRTGTVVIGGALANDVSEFEYGDTVVAQTLLNPPHEDMWVVCAIEDDQGRLIDRMGYPVTRDMLRCNFIYKLGNALVPGDYDFVLRSGRVEVARRRIHLAGALNGPLAN